MAFMEEQGMARSYRLSAEDLIVLSGVDRAYVFYQQVRHRPSLVVVSVRSFAGAGVERQECRVRRQAEQSGGDDRRRVATGEVDREPGGRRAERRASPLRGVEHAQEASEPVNA